jgi:putative DNA primase/helicase
MVPLTADMLRCEADRAAVWFRWGDRGKKFQASPQLSLMRFMLSMPEIYLPKLKKIITAPVFYRHPFVEALQLHSERGYNEMSRMYLDMSMSPAPFVIENPRPEMIEESKAVIDDLLCDFPFADESDRVNAIGLMLLPFVREIIKGPTPLHLIEAPVPGSGKNLLLDVVIPPGVGSNYKLIAEGKDDDEYRKRITSAMIGKTGAIIIDNVAESIASGPLASAITADIWTDRVLGKSEDISIPVRTIWIATANNPVLSMEIARRSVRIRLSPLVDQPWKRGGFRHANLREYVKENRSKICGACLMLCQSWIWSGYASGKVRPLGSFENWTRVIGGILEHVGYHGFLESQADLYDISDSENEAWRLFVDEWFRVYGSAPAGVADLFRIASEIEGFDLRGKDEGGKRRSLGRTLKAHRDRVYNSFKICDGGKDHKLSQWKLIEVLKEDQNRECPEDTVDYTIEGEEDQSPLDFSPSPDPDFFTEV